MNRRYFRCGGCRRIFRSPKLSIVVHCGEEARRITDARARREIEGRPFKGRRMRMKGKVDSKADGEKHRLGTWHRKDMFIGRSET